MEFNPAEELVVVDIVCCYADHSARLNRVEILEEFALVIERILEDHPSRLRFRDGRHGRNVTSGFNRCHNDLLLFSKPIRQEGKRFEAVNAEVLRTHLHFRKNDRRA